MCVYTILWIERDKNAFMLLILDRMRKGIQNIAPKNHNGRYQ